jgi:hypothetical protein
MSRKEEAWASKCTFVSMSESRYMMKVGVRQCKETFTREEVIHYWGPAFLASCDQTAAKQMDDNKKKRETEQAECKEAKKKRRVVGMECPVSP